MRAAGQETLDNKACTRYDADEAEATRLFAALDRDGNLTGSAGAFEGTLQRATMNVWVCDDGYVHQLEMRVDIAPRANPDRTASLGISLRMNDLNIIVPLDPPPDAIPLPNPFLFPTSVPRATPTLQTS
jgi:hypothetical protein